MKKSTLFLAALVLTPALYARAQAPFFTREQVLDVFARFNPLVLDQAAQQKEYKAVLERFLSSYRAEVSPQNERELIAVARNFDTSIRLNILKKVYQNLWLSNRMMGVSPDTARQMFRHDLSEEMAHIWAVTVQLRKYQLAQAQEQLNVLRHTPAGADTSSQEKQLQDEIRSLRAEIKSLEQNSGAYVTAAIDNYVAAVERELEEKNFSTRLAVATQTAQQARASTNLAVKSKNKKPVAK